VTTYFTVAHRDTDEPLGLGGPLDREKCLSILLMRKSATVAGKTVPFLLQEWCVTAWSGDGSDDDEIDFIVSADEFVWAKGNP